MEISNPVLSGNNLTYDAKVLEGAASASGGACTLFIEISECPRTPYSYAGAARRAWRRYGAEVEYHQDQGRLDDHIPAQAETHGRESLRPPPSG